MKVATKVGILIIVIILTVGGIIFYKKSNDKADKATASCYEDSPTQLQIISQFNSDWTEFRKKISEKPTLGVPQWLPPEHYQFIGNNRFFIAFEDGHIILVSLVQYDSNYKFSLIKTFSNFTEGPLFSEAEWNNVVNQYGNAQNICSYTRSIFKNGELINYENWTLVPENIFVLPPKGY